MYKKITCAFCFVISVFVVAVVVYMLWSQTNVFSQPSDIKVPRISIYLLNATSRREQLLHTTTLDSEYILDFQSLGLSEDEMEESSRRNILRVQCHSNTKVQLHYVGYGNITDARTGYRRKIEEFQDSSTYKYFADIEFVTVDGGITGKYLCEIRNDSGDAVKASTFVYVYASGPNTFVSHSAREAVVDLGSFIQVPCPVTHPNKSITLFSVIQPIQMVVEREVDEDRIQSYDPKHGFVLKPDQHGSYVCKDNSASELSGRVTVFMPLRHVVKGKPVRVYSQDVDNNDTSLNLQCHAKEPVDLEFVNFLKFFKQPRPAKMDKEYPFGKRIKLKREWFHGNTSIVKCFTKKDRRVLKVWKFLKNSELFEDGKDLTSPQLYLKAGKFNYQCCVDRGDKRPVLTTYPCHSPAECELRTPCLSYLIPRNRTTLNCPLFDFANEHIYEGEERCTRLNVEPEQAGLIRCSMDWVAKDYVYFYGRGNEETHSSLADLTSKPSRVEPRAVLTLIQKGFRTPSHHKGSPIRFDCVGSKMHFASGFQWATEKANEPIKYLDRLGARITQPVRGRRRTLLCISSGSMSHSRITRLNVFIVLHPLSIPL